ncbi:hypothetical protein HanRHA438_Chr14g0630761 [Helianthus annuus]|nr:hypothetical protein HanIR_Chr14g0671951 [Helianthus annuus]KAJ0838536.1 hypothetical protein HanPSC8_Chr14g0596001 [Helianthus annuus]KAJ0851772.1 hypothetical protein HanRHA438_Chr14g0630761 [Helianthus annuus]
MLTNTMATSILLQQSINCFICNHQFGKNNLAATKPNFVEKCKKLRDIKARVAVDAMETATSPTAFPFFQTEPKQEAYLYKIRVASQFDIFRLAGSWRSG